MPRSTDWQLLSEGRHQYVGSDTVSHTGSACYVIGIRRAGDRKIRTVYVGSTANLLQRMRSHGTEHSNIRDYLSRTTRRGYKVFFRYYKTRTERQAKSMESRLMAKWWKYPWNALGMPF